MNLPASQFVHDDCAPSGGAYLPGEHDAHAVAPYLSAKVPVLQKEQSAAPPVLYVPGLHCVQDVLPTMLYSPLLQLVQILAPVVAPNFPAGQERQVFELVELWYLPTEQSMQDSAPSRLYFPMAQSVHAARPMAPVNLP